MMAAVACSCDAGNALWSRVLEIVNEALEEARQVRVEDANRQLRSKFQEQKTQANKPADTVRTTLNPPRIGKAGELRIRIWEPKK